MPLSRRALLQSSLLSGAVLALPTPARAAKAPPATNVHWLDGSPPAWDGGQSWGTPWPRGTLRGTDRLQVHGADGAILPLQSWPLAYWPDGSIKWSGHALPAMIDRGPSHVSIGIGRNLAPAHPVRVEEQAGAVLVHVGAHPGACPAQAAPSSPRQNGMAKPCCAMSICWPASRMRRLTRNRKICRSSATPAGSTR